MKNGFTPHPFGWMGELNTIYTRKGEGFTLIEVLIVAAISAVLIAISASVFLTVDKRSDVDSEARKFESVLNLARNKTLASEGSQGFGVHIDVAQNEYALFPGLSFDPGNPENEIFSFPSQISVSSLDLNDGGNDIVFTRLKGETSQYGQITIGNAVNQNTICIADSGNVYIKDNCAELFLEYTGGTADSDLASFPSNSGTGDAAQSFTTLSEDIFVKKVDLYIRKENNPSDIYLEIREVSSVGNVLGRSWQVAGDSLPSSLDWVSFIFPSPALLTGNTQYFLRLKSLPSSTTAFSGASGTVIWGYKHAASSPPVYSGGDAWRYVGRLGNPSDQGQQLGPLDQYDFSFRVIYGIDPPPITDSRHLELFLGWSIRNSTTLTLTFHDPGNPDVVENVPMENFFNADSSGFDWEGDIDVNGNIESLRVHTYYLDSNDTMLSIHRDQDKNSKAVDISIDSNEIISYGADGAPIVGADGGEMVYR